MRKGPGAATGPGKGKDGGGGNEETEERKEGRKEKGCAGLPRALRHLPSCVSRSLLLLLSGGRSLPRRRRRCWLAAPGWRLSAGLGGRARGAEPAVRGRQRGLDGGRGGQVARGKAGGSACAGTEGGRGGSAGLRYRAEGCRAPGRGEGEGGAP